MRHGMRCATALAPYMRPGTVADPHHYMFRPPGERELSPEETEALLDALFKTGPIRDPKKE
jgi:hypothetical protein